MHDHNRAHEFSGEVVNGHDGEIDVFVSPVFHDPFYLECLDRGLGHARA